MEHHCKIRLSTRFAMSFDIWYFNNKIIAGWEAAEERTIWQKVHLYEVVDQKWKFANLCFWNFRLASHLHNKNVVYIEKSKTCESN